MPPGPNSRYIFCRGFNDAHGRIALGEREPYRFRELPDTRKHTVTTGDSLFSLAGRYYGEMPRSSGFWWVIADFQPDPIIDATLELQIGRVIYVPATRVVTDVILAEARRRAVG
jgi:hypothetical protein